jgi:hypothetical protein
MITMQIYPPVINDNIGEFQLPRMPLEGLT